MVVEYFFGRRKVKKFENILRQNNYKKDFSYFLKESTALGVILFCASALFMAATKAQGFYMAFLPPLFFAGGFLLNFFGHYYWFEQRKKTIEKFVPDLLLSASVFPVGTSLYKIIEHFSKTNYKFVSDEFEKCRTEILKGNSAVGALENLKARNDSAILSRAVDLIVSGLNSGSDAATVFKDTALDLMETASILRERTAELAIEKYTLLLAGGIIVPAILGMLSAMVLGLNLESLSELGIGLGAPEKKALNEAVRFATPIYLAEYAVIASFFAAFQQGDLKKGIIYCIAMVPFSLAVYYFVPKIF